MTDKAETTQKIKAENVVVGAVLKTWFGVRTVVAIEPYIGKLAEYFCNILVFDSGVKMSNQKGSEYDCTYLPKEQ